MPRGGYRETRDLSASHPEKAAALRSQLDVWLEETGAEFPTSNPNYE